MYAFDPAAEELEIEWNARYDYVSEAYGATARDCDDMAMDDAYYEAKEGGYEGSFADFRRALADKSYYRNTAPTVAEPSDEIPF